MKLPWSGSQTRKNKVLENLMIPKEFKVLTDALSMEKFMSKKLIITTLCVLALFSACARTEKVRALEGDVATPYRELGQLEVYVKSPVVLPGNIAMKTVEAATLTLANTPSRGDQYKKALRKELVRIAKSYDADLVINVEYWPDPDSKTFPEGKIYARGMMIKYRKFPSK